MVLSAMPPSHGECVILSRPSSPSVPPPYDESFTCDNYTVLDDGILDSTPTRIDRFGTDTHCHGYIHGDITIDVSHCLSDHWSIVCYILYSIPILLFVVQPHLWWTYVYLPNDTTSDHPNDIIVPDWTTYGI